MPPPRDTLNEAGASRSASTLQKGAQREDVVETFDADDRGNQFLPALLAEDRSHEIEGLLEHLLSRHGVVRRTLHRMGSVRELLARLRPYFHDDLARRQCRGQLR